jgi:hypothetical protein
MINMKWGMKVFTFYMQCYNTCSLDGALNPWLEELWNILLKEYPLPPNTTILPKDHLPPPKFEVKTLAPSAVTTAFSPKTKRRLLDANIKKYSPKHPFYAKLIQNTRLTSTGASCRCLYTLYSQPSHCRLDTRCETHSTGYHGQWHYVCTGRCSVHSAPQHS